MRMKISILILLAAGLLAGCAPALVGDCTSTDWYALGFRDGQAGRTSARWDAYRSACADHDQTADRESYLRGRREGLREYCTDANGFRIGRGRSSYAYVCPPELETTFLAGRARGMELRGCQAEIYVLDEHINSLELALQSREDALRAPDTPPPATRTRLQNEIADLEALRRRALTTQTAVERRCIENRAK